MSLYHKIPLKEIGPKKTRQLKSTNLAHSCLFLNQFPFFRVDDPFAVNSLSRADLREVLRVVVAGQDLERHGAARLLHDLRQLVGVRHVLAVDLLDDVAHVQQTWEKEQENYATASWTFRL